MCSSDLNKEYCKSIEDNSQPNWEEAPEWQKQSVIKGVEYTLSNPNAKPSDSHNSWLKEKEATGWKYGEVKDVEKKTHPCYVPYDQLPEAQKVKDTIFQTCVRFAITRRIILEMYDS